MSNSDNNKGDINRLAAGIAKAKTIQDKVLNKTYSTGHINSGALVAEENVKLLPHNNGSTYTAPVTSHVQNNVSMDKIGGSKLPDSIKESFMKNPPIGGANPLSMDLMSSVANIVKNTQPQTNYQPQRVVVEHNSQPHITEYVKESAQMITLSIDSLKNIIEEAVEKTINKMVEVTKNDINEKFIIEVSGKKYVATAKLMKEVIIKNNE